MSVEYKREMFDMGGAKCYIRPELPEIKFTKDKVNYSVTDIRVLNEMAVDTFIRCVQTAIWDRDAEKAKFTVGKDITQMQLDLVSDIVTGIKWSSKKGGKKGFYQFGGFIATGSMITENEAGERELEFELITDNVKAIHDFMKDRDAKKLPYFDLVVALSNRLTKDSTE